MARLSVAWRAMLALMVLAGATTPAHANTKRFGLTSFTNIVVLGDMVVDILPDYRLSALAEGSRAALETLDFTVQGDTLTIRQVAEGPYGPRSATDGPIHIRMTAQNLAGLHVRGSAVVTAGRLRGDVVSITLDGAGTIAATIPAGTLVRASARGSGTLSLTGRTTTLDAQVTGSAGIDAAALFARDLSLRQNGTGSSRFTAANTAQITANGQANVTVSGRPRCTVSNLGAGTVSCGADQRRALPTGDAPPSGAIRTDNHVGGT